VNARDDRTVFIGGPTYEGEDAARRERYAAAAAVQNGLMDYVTEADAVLDSLLDSQEFDLCDIV
jgi:hypothetical protein